MLAVPLAARAQETVEFLPTGVADWGLDVNWQDYGFGQNVPDGDFNEVAIINSGGTAYVDSAFNDATPPGGPGEVLVSNGTLEIRDTGELTLGEPGSSIQVDRSVTIGDALHIQGGGQLNAASIAFQDGANFAVEVTDDTDSPVEVSGSAVLNGALHLDYSAVTEPAGSRTLISAGSVGGSFDAVDWSGLGPAQGVRITRGEGAVEAAVQDLLTMTVDRQSGAVTIDNPHASGIDLDGYGILSAAGSLHPAGLAGLGSGWSTSASNSPHALTQLFEGTMGSPSTSIAGGATPSIAAAGLFAPAAPTEFLQDVEDLEFHYTDAEGTVQGVVNYVGGQKVHNNIVLTIDGDGQAALLNTSPFAQQVEAYRILSDDDPLQAGSWNSLADQNIDDGTWSESDQTDTAMLLELQEDGTTTFDNSTVYDIGQVLSPGYSQSGLTFEFLLAGESTLTEGVVVFDDLPVVTGVPGDYNGNQVVDAADYTVWRDRLGQAFQLDNEVPGTTPGQVTIEDYAAWKARFGDTAAGSAALAVGQGAVPEPGSMALALMALGSLGIGCRRVVKL